MRGMSIQPDPTLISSLTILIITGFFSTSKYISPTRKDVDDTTIRILTMGCMDRYMNLFNYTDVANHYAD